MAPKTTASDSPPVGELSDKELRRTAERASQTIAEIEAADPSEVVRSGQADEVLSRLEHAIDTVELAEEELAGRRHRSLPERLGFARALERGKRQVHPAAKWLDVARRYSAPELRGETLVASQLSDDDAAELEKLVRRKREIVNDEHAPPFTDDEKRHWESLLGRAAGDSELFEKKRRDAQARVKLAELQDERKAAGLQRQPLLAEPGSVQLPRILFRWLTGDSARETGAITLTDIGVLYGVLACFQNDDASLFPNARFEGDADARTLVVPAGIGADLRTHGQTAGSPHDASGSGHVRLRPALAVLALNGWLEVEQTVGELRIRLGERARKLNVADVV